MRLLLGVSVVVIVVLADALDCMAGVSRPVVRLIVRDLEDSNFGVLELLALVGVVSVVMVLSVLLDHPVALLPVHVHLRAFALGSMEVRRRHLVVRMVVLLDLLGYPGPAHEAFVIVVFILLIAVRRDDLLCADSLLMLDVVIVHHDVAALRDWLNRILAAIGDNLKVNGGS